MFQILGFQKLRNAGLQGCGILLYLAIGASTFFNSANAQTPIFVGPQTSTFTSMVRGYYFVAPVNFTICRLYVEPELSLQMQHVEVVRINAVPPTYPSTTNSFTSMFYQNNFVPNTPITCNIPILAGQIIGVYGARGNTTNMQVSYGNAPWVTPIYGNNATLYYSGMQFPLNNQQMHDIWYANFSRLSRVTMYYDCIILAEGLLAFDGENVEGNSLLNWKLEASSKWRTFELERSLEGQDFQRIASIQRQYQQEDFTFSDAKPGIGGIHYRIRLIDDNGESTYTESLRLEFAGFNKMSVFPHPAPTNGFFLRLGTVTDMPMKVTIIDLQGKKVWEELFIPPSPIDRMQISLNGISSGMYLLEIRGEMGVQTTKLLLK